MNSSLKLNEEYTNLGWILMRYTKKLDFVEDANSKRILNEQKWGESSNWGRKEGENGVKECEVAWVPTRRWIRAPQAATQSAGVIVFVKITL